ncbi:MAG: Si-specific NAD(P)(+) transhydrogenase [Alphaproteobacteria bacterium]|nr:Si-specific NAD(P)(+) transhydrogenase [Alphaproteobacteria bacterium]
MTDYDYDLFVIGSGPAGQRAAIQAAKLGKRVAVAEQKAVVGGACINTGTIPSKTLREAALYLSGYRERGVYGASYTVKEKITMADLHYRTDYVIKNEIDVTRHQLQRNKVDLLTARAAFAGPHTVRLDFSDGSGVREVTTDRTVISVGTVPYCPSGIPFDRQRVFTSDDILALDTLPRTLAVIGAGVIGCEYATIFASLGVRVTVIDKRTRLLPFVDGEITDALAYHMRQNRVTLRLGEEVASIELLDTDQGERVRVKLASGKHIMMGAVLCCTGRTGATEWLDLGAAGVAVNNRGGIDVNEHYQTSVPHIYAVGDVVGFPSLASTSMEQGRLAACHAFGVKTNSSPALFPYGIYTIPEISFVGRSEEELTEAGIPYEVGKAAYREIARGQILGDSTGLLKLIFHMETRELLGVSILGEGASELVHIGQAVLALGGKIDYFVNTVFNYPTLAECYKTAAFDGVNRLC